MTEHYPYQGLQVVEFNTAIAGAYAGKMLADAGASVTRLEPAGGDPLRRWKASAALGLTAPLSEGETGPLFHYLNGNKHSRVLEPDLAACLAQQCYQADILIVEEDGLSESERDQLTGLHRRYPRLTLVLLSAWGDDGPCRGHAANAFSLQAEVGSTAYRGYTDREPVAAGGQLGAFLVGTYAAVAAVSGWLMATRHGRGPRVEVAAFEALLLSMQAYQFIHSQLEPGVPALRSVEVPCIEPASDGWVGFCTVTSQQWQALAELMEQPQLGADPNMANSELRFRHLDEVQPLIHAWTRQRRVEDIVERASAARIPVAPVGNGKSVLEMAQTKARACYQDNPAGFKQPRPPYRLGKGALRSAAAAPGPGEDATAVAPSSARPTGFGAEGDLPLAGMTVVDFTAFWAGPFASACLGALGAEVIKIESIQRPDGMRFAAGMKPGDKPLWEISSVTHGANTNKLGITLDLESPRGRELVEQLIRQADIVIENFSPRVLEQFDLGWDKVEALNPDAILVRMPAFGLEGPWRDRTGFAMTIEQVSGLAWLTGFPDRSPLVPRGCVDPLGGMNAVFATLAALQLRARGLGGQQVEVPLVEAGLAIAAEQVLEYTAFGQLLERQGNSSPEACPQGVFKGRDGNWLGISVSRPEHWQALCARPGLEALRDPALQDPQQRRQHQDRILQQLSHYCSQSPAQALAGELATAGVPAAYLRNVRDLHTHPQLHARGFYQRRTHAVAGELDYPSFPFRFDGSYLPIRHVAPLLGEHNRLVLGQRLGLDDDALERLERDAVIGYRPRFA
ncbi:MAG TPA: CoA transferase [Spongiibacteraceae bacterium]|nr:CoA transferase [Spongiibacteraceae bacterium]